MKNKIFSYLILSVAILSLIKCAPISDDKPITIPEIPPTKVSINDGVIPDTVHLFQLVCDPSKYSWKDFDHYYRVTLPKYHTDTHYSVNLKKATIYGAISSGKLLDNADKKTIEWYTQELLSFELPDTDVLIQCFESLKGYWPDSKIKKNAEAAYEDLIMYIKGHLKYPEQVLTKNETRYNRLRDYAANIKLD